MPSLNNDLIDLWHIFIQDWDDIIFLTFLKLSSVLWKVQECKGQLLPPPHAPTGKGQRKSSRTSEENKDGGKSWRKQGEFWGAWGARRGVDIPALQGIYFHPSFSCLFIFLFFRFLKPQIVSSLLTPPSPSVPIHSLQVLFSSSEEKQVQWLGRGIFPGKELGGELRPLFRVNCLLCCGLELILTEKLWSI